MPSQIRELADVAFRMDNVLKLHFGESNLPTPNFIKAAAAQALADGYTYYTENGGLPELRETIAAKYQELHAVSLDPNREIAVTASGTQAFNIGVRCAIDPGSEAMILTPNWPNGSEVVRLYGATPVEVPFAFDVERYRVDMEALEDAVNDRTRLLVYSSPSNPLGWVASVDEQRALLDFCRRHGLWLLADEVYERLYYRGAVAPSILRLCTRDDAVIVTQSFSKTYCMTGWRLGWLVSRGDLVRKATQLNEFVVSCAPAMVQRAGMVALQRGEEGISAMAKALQEQMSFCYDALAAVDRISLAEPDGAFYLFPRITGVENSFDYAVQLLKDTHVSLCPGSAFGNGGEGSLRLCFASDMSVLEPAMERVTKFIQNN
jgi:aspartate/methionine/tyrosine aminotransferase